MLRERGHADRSKCQGFVMSELETVLTQIDTDMDAALERLFTLLRIKSISTEIIVLKIMRHLTPIESACFASTCDRLKPLYGVLYPEHAHMMRQYVFSFQVTQWRAQEQRGREAKKIMELYQHEEEILKMLTYLANRLSRMNFEHGGQYEKGVRLYEAGLKRLRCMRAKIQQLKGEDQLD